MKRLFLGVFVLLLFSTLVSAQTLKLSMINQGPDPVRAGDVVEVRFKLENYWEDTKKDIRVEILPEYPFSLYQSSAVKELGKLDGRQYGADAVFVDFKLKVDADAVDGENEIRLNVYEGNLKSKYEDSFFIDVENEKIALRPYLSDSDLVMGGSQGKVTLEIANAGRNDVKALELRLLPSEDYKLLSTSDYVYIGDVDIDDTESEDFDIYVDEGVTQVHIPFTLTYEVNEHDYTETHTLTLNLLTKEEAKKVGKIKANYLPYIVAVLVVLIGTIIVVRKKRKK